MKTVHLIPRLLVAGVFVLMAFHGVEAAEEGSTPDGMAYASGGVGDTERQSLLEQKNRFNFWIMTASRRSGAYVSGAQVRIVDLKSKQPVLEHTMDGPWLFAALPPGKYQVETTYQDGAAAPEQMVKKVTTIGSGKTLRKMMLYFNTTDSAESRE